MTDQNPQILTSLKSREKATQITYRKVGDLDVPENVPPRFFGDLNDLEKSIVDAAICQLRVSGMTYDSIAKAINKTYNMNVDRSGIYKRYSIYIKNIPTETLEEARTLTLMRASSIYQHAYQRFREGGSPEFGKIAVAANEQMIKMLGLDAPQEIVVNNDEKLESVRQKLLERAAELEAPGDNSSVIE